jgi:hypothetical protein
VSGYELTVGVWKGEAYNNTTSLPRRLDHKADMTGTFVRKVV